MSRSWVDFHITNSGLSKDEFAEWLNEKEINRGRAKKVYIEPIGKIGTAVLTLDLRVTSLPKSFDPIVKSMPVVCKRFGMSPSTFLRALYFDLLHINGLIDPTGKLIGNTLEIVQSTKEWAPYRWRASAFVVKQRPFKRTLRGYPFLSRGSYGANYFIPVRIKKDQHDVVSVSLNAICSELHRSRAGLFKLLYISFLRWHEVTTDVGLLKADFRKRIRNISQKDVIRLSCWS